jgi:peptide/nickel transport system permease protein
MAFFADWLAPYGWNEGFLAHRLEAPSGQFLLGTDNIGRDLLSRIIFGARISMMVGFFGTILNIVVKLSIAIPSGYFLGTFDIIVQRIVDAWNAIPSLIILLTIMGIVGPGVAQIILVLGISGGIGASRGIRSRVISIRSDQYFEAARAIGVPLWRIFLRHVLPNIMPLVIISAASGVGGLISAEASLSFLGFGIPPPYPSWGGMLTGAGRTYMFTAPWLMMWPGLALSLVIFSCQMLADALRDLADPRLRGGLGRYGGMTQQQLQKLAEKLGGKKVAA